MGSNSLIVYEPATSQWDNSALGTNGNVLTVDNTNPPTNLSWLSPPGGTATDITAGKGLAAIPTNPVIGTGTLVLDGNWGVATLANSIVTVADVNIRSTSVVIASYAGDLNPSVMKSLCVSLNPGIGITIQSSHGVDNNLVFFETLY